MIFPVQFLLSQFCLPAHLCISFVLWFVPKVAYGTQRMCPPTLGHCWFFSQGYWAILITFLIFLVVTRNIKQVYACWPTFFHWWFSDKEAIQGHSGDCLYLITRSTQAVWAMYMYTHVSSVELPWLGNIPGWIRGSHFEPDNLLIPHQRNRSLTQGLCHKSWRPLGGLLSSAPNHPA